MRGEPLRKGIMHEQPNQKCMLRQFNTRTQLEAASMYEMVGKKMFRQLLEVWVGRTKSRPLDTWSFEDRQNSTIVSAQ
jgi:hypothetical protein